MSAKILIVISILLSFFSLANSQELPKRTDKGELITKDIGTTKEPLKIPVTTKPILKDVVTPEQMPKEITIDRKRGTKKIRIDPGTPGSPAIDMEIIQEPDKEKVTIKFMKKEYTFRPSSIQRLEMKDPILQGVCSAITQSKVYPQIKAMGGQIFGPKKFLIDYKKQNFKVLPIPVLKDGNLTDTMVCFYKFEKADNVVLFRLLEKRQLEITNGTTGEKVLLSFTPEGELKLSFLKQHKVTASFLSAREAYALEEGWIKECLGSIFKDHPDWGVRCFACIMSLFTKRAWLISSTCSDCFNQLLGIVGNCIQAFEIKNSTKIHKN
jgi:hypothetical protein